MQTANILSIVSFALSLLLATLLVIGSCLKCTSLGRQSIGFPLVLYVLAVFFFVLSQAILHILTERDAWGTAYIGIVLEFLLSFLAYGFLVGQLIFTQTCIYEITFFLLPKRRSYDDVKHYKGKFYHTKVRTSRFGDLENVTGYEFEIFFKDGKSRYFCFDNEKDENVLFIKSILKEKATRNNSRKKKTSSDDQE